MLIRRIFILFRGHLCKMILKNQYFLHKYVSIHYNLTLSNLAKPRMSLSLCILPRFRMAGTGCLCTELLRRPELAEFLRIFINW